MSIKGFNENNLIGAIYDAALNPDLWRQILANIREWADAKHCNLIFYDIAHPGRNKIYFGGYYSEDIVDRYYGDLIHTDIRTAKLIQANNEDGVFVDNYRYGESDKNLDEFLTKELSHGPIRGSRLFNVSYSSAYFSVIRRAGDKDFENEIEKRLSHLSAHLCRAMRIHHQLQTARNEQKKIEAVLDKTAAGVVLLDITGAVVFCNQEAARILEYGTALRIARGNRLQAAQLQDQIALEKLIAEAMAFSDGGYDLTSKHLSIPIRHESLLHPLKVSVIPLRSAVSDGASIGRKIVAAVFISDPQRVWNVPADYLQKAYALTDTECAVSRFLINGANPSSVAAQRGTAAETARWQVKKIMEKTQTNSQAELSKLLVGLNCDFGNPVA